MSWPAATISAAARRAASASAATSSRRAPARASAALAVTWSSSLRDASPSVSASTPATRVVVQPEAPGDLLQPGLRRLGGLGDAGELGTRLSGGDSTASRRSRRAPNVSAAPATSSRRACIAASASRSAAISAVACPSAATSPRSSPASALSLVLDGVGGRLHGDRTLVLAQRGAHVGQKLGERVLGGGAEVLALGARGRDDLAQLVLLAGDASWAAWKPWAARSSSAAPETSSPAAPAWAWMTCSALGEVVLGSQDVGVALVELLVGALDRPRALVQLGLGAADLLDRPAVLTGLGEALGELLLGGAELVEPAADLGDAGAGVGLQGGELLGDLGLVRCWARGSSVAARHSSRSLPEPWRSSPSCSSRPRLAPAGRCAASRARRRDRRPAARPLGAHGDLGAGLVAQRVAPSRKASNGGTPRRRAGARPGGGAPRRRARRPRDARR